MGYLRKQIIKAEKRVSFVLAVASGLSLPTDVPKSIYYIILVRK